MIVDITVLSQANCGYCDEAQAVLDRLDGEYPLQIRVLDLALPEAQDLAERAGMLFPPAVFVDDEPFSYGRLSERKLRRALDRKLGRP